MTLLDQVRALDDAALERLLTTRPDLLLAGDLEELAQRAGSHRSLGEAVASLTRPQRQVLEAITFLPVGSNLTALDAGADPAALDRVVGELRELLLVRAGSLQPVGNLATFLPTPLGLGRPVVECFVTYSHWVLSELLQQYDEPRPRSRETGAQALARIFNDPVIIEMIHDLPEPILALLQRADSDGPVLRIKGVDASSGFVPDVPGLRDAVQLGMLAIVGNGRVELPREIGLALRFPKVTTFDLVPAPDGAHAPAPGQVAAACAHQVQQLLAGVTLVAERLGARPLARLGSGAVGVKDIRALAVGLPSATAAAFVLRLLDDLKLLTETRKEYRLAKGFWAWNDGTDAERWQDLAAAWLSCVSEPPVRPDAERPLKAALSWDYDRRFPGLRRELVVLLATSDEQAREWLVAWHECRPEERLTAYDGMTHVMDRERRADTLYEAELLGLIAVHAPTPVVRALHHGRDLGTALANLEDEGELTVRAQADLTLICTGRPALSMRKALGRLAVVEQEQQATVWRVTEVGLGTAYLEGDSPEEALAVLRKYAGVLPQAMEYLVKDAHRRYAPVIVGGASAFAVVGDDQALQAALQRRASAKVIKASGLRRVAPGVAVSNATVEATLAVLRELGLPAVAEGALSTPARRTSTAAARELRALPELDVRPRVVAWVAAART